MNINWQQAKKGDTGAMVAQFESDAIQRGTVEFVPSQGRRDCFREGADGWLYVERPSTWNGEGLPPAETVVELRTVSVKADWAKAKIKFASRNVVVWDWDGEPAVNGLCTAYAHAIEMRPVRTPEQIAAEEKQRFMEDLYEVVKDCDCKKSWLEAMGAIYDAGYRKQVAP